MNQRWESKRQIRKTRETFRKTINDLFTRSVEDATQIKELTVWNHHVYKVNQELHTTIESMLDVEQALRQELEYVKRNLAIEEKAHAWRTRERDALLMGEDVSVAVEETAFADALHKHLVEKIESLKEDLQDMTTNIGPVEPDDVQWLFEQRNELVELRYKLRNACDAADAMDSRGRSGRIGTKLIHNLIGD